MLFETKAKLVYDWSQTTIKLFTSGAYLHEMQDKKGILLGLQPKLRPLIVEAVKDGMMREDKANQRLSASLAWTKHTLSKTTISRSQWLGRLQEVGSS